jgi:methionyl-tRNA formyltransferase
MRILFAGSPAIAVPALSAIAAEGGNEKEFVLAGLLTNPDSPKGRSGRPEPTDCAAAGQRFSVPLLKPEKLDGIAREQTAALRPDILVSFAYSRIFGPRYLALFPLGGVNIHPSLLPRFRGPAPIPAAIINRETVTGITIQRLAAEMDTGDILAQEEVPLSGRETTADLGETMAKKAAEMLPAVLRGLAAGTLRGSPQDHSAATYCSLLDKKDGLIDWSRSAVEIEARIRAFNPWPLSWTTHGGLELFILKAEALDDDTPLPNAALPHPHSPILSGQVLGKDKNKGILIQTGKGILAVTELQYRTKKAMDWKAFLNGARNLLDARLDN